MTAQETTTGGAIVAPPVCQWFAYCTNLAAGVVNHPILGDVPTCTRCAEKLELDVRGARWATAATCATCGCGPDLCDCAVVAHGYHDERHDDCTLCVGRYRRIPGNR